MISFWQCNGHEASNDSGVIENGNFQYFLSLFRHKLYLEAKPTLLSSTGVTLYCRVTLNEKSNNDMFDNFYCYEQRYSQIILYT